MIEPPAFGGNDGHGGSHANFGSLPPDGYLTLTREWVDKFLATTWPKTYQARSRILSESGCR